MAPYSRYRYHTETTPSDFPGCVHTCIRAELARKLLSKIPSTETSNDRIKERNAANAAFQEYNVIIFPLQTIGCCCGSSEIPITNTRT